MSETMRNYATAEKKYHSMNTVSDSGSSVANFRTLVIKSDEAQKAKKARLEAEIKDISATYSNAVALPKIAELRRAFDADTRTTREKLHERLNQIIEAKQGATKDYILTPPTTEQITLLQSLRMRDVKRIPDSEWDMLVSAVSDNHQAAQILKNIADDAGRSLVLPFDVDNTLDDISTFKQRAEMMIDSIGDLGSNYFGMEWLATDNPDTLTSELITKLDSEIATTIPAASATVHGRLREARDHALHMGDLDTFNAITNFLIGNADKLQTEKERAADFRDEAERLIEMGMNAEERKPSYEAHRDFVIRDLEQAVEGKND